MSRLVASTLILILVATACSSTVEASTVRTVDIGHTEVPTGAQGASGRASATLALQTWPDWTLASFDDCDRLLDHIQAEALSRVGAFGLDRGQYGRSLDDDVPLDDTFGADLGDDMAREFLDDVVGDDFESSEEEAESDMDSMGGMADDMAGDDMGADDMGADDMGDMGDMGPAMDIATDDGDGGAEVEFSGTNVQVTGVDEPDIVKTDGRRIITVSQGILTAVDVTGDVPQVMGHVALPEFVDEPMSRIDGDMDGDMGPDMGPDMGGDAAPTAELLLHGDRVLAIRNEFGSIRPHTEVVDRGGTRHVVVVIYEVLLDGTPRRGRTMRVEGRYVSSRSIGSSARIVINSFPDEPTFVRPLNREGIAVATEVNRHVVEQTTLSDWLPDYSLTAGDGSVLEQGEPFLACDRVHVPREFGGFGTASVLTVDLDEPLTPDDGAATFAVAETVYASLQNLYVATSAWVPASDLVGSEIAGRAAARYATSIHKFSLGIDGSAEYEASGAVAGHLLNQFALHERSGHLFVATTDGPPRRFGGTVSRIVALRQQGDELVEVGQVGDLGRGERIFAVRYIGDRAYVVTFRRVDPLYVVDLSDPTRPTVLGELKIPGFSSYLHPIGDGLLVGVGRDVTDGGWDRGLKISLFDVSDASDPREIDTWTLRRARSEVGSDHRSFLWWGRDQLMVLPMFLPNRRNGNQAYAFRVTRSEGISEIGLITHSPAELRISTECLHEFLGPDEESMQRDALLRLICKEGQAPNATGYKCGQSTVGRVDWTAAERSALPSTVSDEDIVYSCVPLEGRPLRRSLVIGEDLWTMSASLLQRNDLATLQRGDRVPLPAAGEVAPDRPPAPVESTTSDPVAPLGPDEPQPQATVTRFGDCPGLLGHIRTEAASAVGAYGFDRGRFGSLADRSKGEDGDDSWRVLAAGDDVLQDFIETDGRRIVTTVGDTLTVVDIADAEPSVVGRLALDLDRTVRLMMRGNRVLVIGENGAGGSGASRTSVTGSFDTTVVVREFLVGDQLRRGRSMYIEGRLLEARSNAGRARIVVRSAPKDLGLVYPASEAAERVAAAGNRQSIQRSTLGNWLPRYSLVAGNGLLLAEGQLLSCNEVVVPSEFSGVGLVSALTLNLEQSIKRGTAAAIFGEDVATLATGQSLYVATESWPESSRDGDAGRETAASAPAATMIHRFTLDHWWRASYEASGQIDGSLIGPSPLHERDGRLFAAVDELVSSSGDERREPRIVVLERDGDSLVTVGRSDVIGSRYATTVVRYVGDRAFTRTERSWDSIRVVDLHDHKRPSAAGELLEPTYSNSIVVLQPVGDDELVTVESARSSRDPTIEVTSFAVSDGKLRETGSRTLRGITSRATSDPRRLLWSEQARLLVIPVVEESGRARHRGVAVFTVNSAGDVTYLGHVGPHEHRGDDAANDVFRSLTVGDELWTLSASYSRRNREASWLLQSNDLDTLERKAAVALND